MKIAGVVVWMMALVAAYSVGASAPIATQAIGSLEAALEDRNPLERSRRLSEYLLGLGPDNIESTLKVVTDQAYWFDKRDHQLLMDAWVRFDSLAAVDWAFARSEPLRKRASSAAIWALGFHDPAAARSMLETVDVAVVDELFHTMVEGWALSDRTDSLASYLSRLLPGKNRQHATGTLARIMVSHGVDDAIAWAEQAPTLERFNWLAFQKTASAIAEIDPARAASWLDEHPDEPWAIQSRSIVTRRWFGVDPAGAMNWLISLPADDGRRDRVKLAFLNWVKEEPKEARAWVVASTPNAAVDPAVRVLVRMDFDRNPARSMDWAHRIERRGLRSRVQASAGRGWFAKDPDAFMAWLPNSGLEDQISSVILNTRSTIKGGGRPDTAPDPLSETDPATIDPVTADLVTAAPMT